MLHKLREEPAADADHFVLDVLIVSERHRRTAARCVEDVVVYDYKTARKSTLPRFMVEQFRDAFALQEQAKEANLDGVRRLLQRVRELEKASWDRDDAQEDLGSVVAGEDGSVVDAAVRVRCVAWVPGVDDGGTGGDWKEKKKERKTEEEGKKGMLGHGSTTMSGV